MISKLFTQFVILVITCGVTICMAVAGGAAGSVAMASTKSPFSFEITPFADLDRDQALNIIDDLDELKSSLKNFYAEVNKINKARPVRIADVDEFASLVYDYLSFRRSIVELVKPYEFLVSKHIIFSISTKRPTLLEERYEIQGGGPATSQYYVRVNPNDKLGQEVIHIIKLNLSLSLTLFDVYSHMIDPMMDNKKLRRLFEADHEVAYKRLLLTQNDFVNHLDRFPLEQLVQFYAELNKKAPNQVNQIRDGYFYDAIMESNSYKLLSTGKYKNAKHMLERPVMVIKDSVSLGIKKVTYVASEAFGNFVGRFQFRHGKLDHLDAEAKKALKAKLKPLDILIERTPFRLTDRLIPGYYGHVAMWLGTEEELKELDLWEHPAIIPLQSEIRAGKSIVESVRIPGVRLNDFDSFLDIDDLLILRRKNLVEFDVRNFILEAVDLIGRPYDFNFDVETSDEIICSEVVYHVFNDMKWPTDKTLGRFTVSPDHIAARAIHGENSNKDFEIIELYKDGVSIIKDDSESVLSTNLLGPN